MLRIISYLTKKFNLRKIKPTGITGHKEYSEFLDKHQIKYLHQINQLVLEHLREGVLVIHTVSKVIHQYNHSAEDIFGPLQLGATLPLLENYYHEWQEQALTQSDFPVKFTYEHKNLIGRLISVNEQYQTIWVILIRDEHDLAAEARRSKLAALGRLTANIAHEIRNPLSAIRQSAELLIESHQEKFNHNDSDLKLMTLIQSNSHRINRMIHEVLSLNRKDQLQPELIDVYEFWSDFKTQFLLQHPHARKKIHDYLHVKNPRFFFDRGHLYQIMWNLMNNAWRHADCHDPLISISFREDRLHYYIDIQDNGSGIPEKIRGQVFEPFFTTESQGTGLGLYIARELAEANRCSLNYIPPSGYFSLACYKYEL
jgi:two-component system sensor histidine kinase PilS (NtrC family)